MLDELSRAITIIAHGLEKLVRDTGDTFEKNRKNSTKAMFPLNGSTNNNTLQLAASIDDKRVPKTSSTVSQESSHINKSISNSYNDNGTSFSAASGIIAQRKANYKQSLTELDSNNNNRTLAETTNTSDKATIDIGQLADRESLEKDDISSWDIATSKQASSLTNKEHLEKVLNFHSKCFGKIDKLADEKGDLLYE